MLTFCLKNTYIKFQKKKKLNFYIINYILYFKKKLKILIFSLKYIILSSLEKIKLYFILSCITY
jgi:hypothetical protein